MKSRHSARLILDKLFVLVSYTIGSAERRKSMRFIVIVAVACFLIGCDWHHGSHVSVEYTTPYKMDGDQSFVAGQICVGGTKETSFTVINPLNTKRVIKDVAPPQDPAIVNYCEYYRAATQTIEFSVIEGCQNAPPITVDLQKGQQVKVFVTWACDP